MPDPAPPPNLTPDGSVEYDCRDCGRHVIAFGFNTQIERCNTCHWIVTMLPCGCHTEVRERLGVPLVPSEKMQ